MLLESVGCPVEQAAMLSLLDTELQQGVVQVMCADGHCALLEAMPTDDRPSLVSLLAPAQLAEVLLELSDELQAQVMSLMTPKDLQSITDAISARQLAKLSIALRPDCRAVLLGKLDYSEMAQVFSHLKPYERDQILSVLPPLSFNYPDDQVEMPPSCSEPGWLRSIAGRISTYVSHERRSKPRR